MRNVVAILLTGTGLGCLPAHADVPYTLQGSPDDSAIRGDPAMMKALQYLHDNYGQVVLASGRRSSADQAAIRAQENCGVQDCRGRVGGTETSQHVRGVAADIGVGNLQGMAYCQALAKARSVAGIQGGIGVYADAPNSGHIDHRGMNVGWNVCQSVGASGGSGGGGGGSSGSSYFSPVVEQYERQNPDLFSSIMKMLTAPLSGLSSILGGH